jgi:hypothetical protein
MARDFLSIKTHQYIVLAHCLRTIRPASDELAGTLRFLSEDNRGRLYQYQSSSLHNGYSLRMKIRPASDKLAGTRKIVIGKTIAGDCLSDKNPTLRIVPERKKTIELPQQHARSSKCGLHTHAAHQRMRCALRFSYQKPILFHCLNIKTQCCVMHTHCARKIG